MTFEVLPTALPTTYDLTDPASNLAALLEEANSFGLLPSVLEDNRFLMGAEYVPALFAGAYGYRRSGDFFKTLLWALAGYMAPLPVAGVIAFEAGTGRRAFGGLGGGQWFDIKTGDEPEYDLKCARWRRGSDGKRRCVQYVRVPRRP